jgi:hypothetical protein
MIEIVQQGTKLIRTKEIEGQMSIADFTHTVDG